MINCEQKQYLQIFDYYQELFSDSETLYQDKCFSTKTLPQESSLEQSSNIRGNNFTRLVNKRELRLVQENVMTFQHMVSQSRKINRNILPLASSCTFGRKIKRINKNHTRAKKYRKNAQDDTTQYSKSCFLNLMQDQKLGLYVEQFSAKICKGVIRENNSVQGPLGFATIILNNKIIQGSYYLQIAIQKSSEELDYINNSDIRIGICSENHKLDIPLGYKNSIGFSLSYKQIITEGHRVKLNSHTSLQKLQFKQGDVVGMKLDFSPPHRSPNPEKNWQQSNVTFYINGNQIGKYEGIKQMFYNPAVSLYNGARVKIITKEEEINYMPLNCIAYQKISQYINIYK